MPFVRGNTLANILNRCRDATNQAILFSLKRPELADNVDFVVRHLIREFVELFPEDVGNQTQGEERDTDDGQHRGNATKFPMLQSLHDRAQTGN